ncbi:MULTISPECIES: hypothetical protein [Methylocystis]|uniref:hypothetical protein n=1 Tax=Methylocystis TaxID=133 RepID=UPI0024BA18A7|nr:MULTISPECIES: hypothetical protein [Methylocystis]MDJ0448381.1 hypothetical protein [Methylocystis sp. JR02]
MARAVVARAAVSAAVAILLLLQAASIGFAAGATANGAAGLLFGTICQNADAANRDSSGPIEQQHVGPCCVLHCSSFIEADAGRAPVEILPLESVSASPACDHQIDAVIVAPELRALCPRAPPPRGV